MRCVCGKVVMACLRRLSTASKELLLTCSGMGSSEVKEMGILSSSIDMCVAWNVNPAVDICCSTLFEECEVSFVQF